MTTQDQRRFSFCAYRACKLSFFVGFKEYSRIDSLEIGQKITVNYGGKLWTLKRVK